MKYLITIAFIWACVASNPLSADYALNVQTTMVSGSIVAVWETKQTSSDLSYIQAANKPFGGLWTAPVTLSLAGQDARLPLVSTNQSRNSVAIWKVVDITGLTRNSVLFAAMLPSGGSWSLPVIVTLSTEDLINYTVNIDNNNNVVVSWTSGNSRNLFVATALFGGSWSVPLQISNL